MTALDDLAALKAKYTLGLTQHSASVRVSIINEAAAIGQRMARESVKPDAFDRLLDADDRHDLPPNPQRARFVVIPIKSGWFIPEQNSSSDPEYTIKTWEGQIGRPSIVTVDLPRPDGPAEVTGRVE